MKITSLITPTILLLTGWNCTSQTNVSPENLSKIVAEKRFSFKPQRAHPANQEVRTLFNTHPTHNSAMLYELSTDHYSVDIKTNNIQVNLPYYGRRFVGTMNPSDNGLNFETSNFNYQIKNTKKGGYIVTISPDDVKHVSKIFIEISKNGKGYLSVQPNDRTPISYSGYVIETKSETK